MEGQVGNGHMTSRGGKRGAPEVMGDKERGQWLEHVTQGLAGALS